MNENEKKVSTRPTIEQINEELRRLEERKSRSGVVKRIIAVLLVVAAAAVLVAMLWLPVLQAVGTSMAPTLSGGDVVIVAKSGNIERGDIVAFYHNDIMLIKRVVGVPGDVISIDEDGNVFVNGEAADEPFVEVRSAGKITVEFPLTVPEDSWFVLGDNRSISMDSRSAELGTVSSGRIIGRVALRVWPLSGFGRVK